VDAIRFPDRWQAGRGGLSDVAMTSLAELGAEQRRPPPSDAEIRVAVAEALGA
jgi:lipoyl(octanoyl) transferase